MQMVTQEQSRQVSNTTIAGFPAIQVEGRPDRPAVLFLHGAFVTHECFSRWLDVMARAGYRAVAVSRRGRLGVGPERAEGLRFADYLDDTMRVLDALGERPIVVGHSLGGLLAQKVAEAGRAEAIALLSPAPPGMLTAQLVALPAFLPMLPKILLGSALVPKCTTCDAIALNCMPVERRKSAHEKLVHESGAAYRELVFGSIRVDSSRVRCPVYVTGGAEDRIVSQSLLRSTARRYGVEPVVLQDHGHWLLEEPGWELIATAVADWIDRIVGR
jgi:pimeloyl-ACP methyl ester carboxylesterase